MLPHTRPTFWLAAAALVACATTVPAQEARPPQSFYVQSEVEGGQQIVDVRQEGREVRVRTITVAAENDQCPQVIVRAHDTVLRDTSIASVAGAPLCGISETRFDRAVRRSRDRVVRTIDWFGWQGSVVATCEGQERRFAFIERPGDQLDAAALVRRDPDVHRVWLLTTRATRQGLASQAARPPQEQREDFGTSLVPDLVSGLYETAFRDACLDERTGRATACQPNYFAWRLEGYTAPPAERGPRPLRLVDHDHWRFDRYVAPVFPPLALAARVTGDVRMRLRVDDVTGAVTDVALADGPPLLTNAAVGAARQWRFVPGSTPRVPFEVTLRFQVECPAR